VTREAVLFDLFDTLVLFDRSRLPEVRANGKTMRSTAGHLHEAFRPFAPGLELDDFVSSLFWSWQEAERIRGETHREVAASASTAPPSRGRRSRCFSRPTSAS
jgi:hypothetical protein